MKISVAQKAWEWKAFRNIVFTTIAFHDEELLDRIITIFGSRENHREEFIQLVLPTATTTVDSDFANFINFLKIPNLQ